MSLRTSVCAGLTVMLLAGSAWAHHNMSALFDFNDRVTVTGNLSKIDWRNPHIYLAVDVTSGAEQGQSWSIEGPPPNFFRTRHNQGRSRGHLETGDRGARRARTIPAGSPMAGDPGRKSSLGCPQNVRGQMKGSQ